MNYINIHEDQMLVNWNSDLWICSLFHSKRRLTSCTLLTKTERFSFYSGRGVRVVKLIKENWPINNFILQYFITKVLEHKAEQLNLYGLLCVP